MKHHRSVRMLMAAAAGLGLLSAIAACSGSSSPAAPSAAAAPAASLSVATSLTELLVATYQDERHAEKIYERVLADFGSVFPFVNIVEAERKHASSVARLMTSRGLAVPESAWTTGNVPGFSSVPAACAAAATAEVDNVALYDRYLALDLPADVRTVFQNNRAASINNHLPAFNRCR